MLLFLLQISCKQNARESTTIILENGMVNADFFQTIDEPERALLCWYLFAYGNECIASSEKSKCKLLTLLDVENECSEKHTRFLKLWFADDIYMNNKLQRCPNLPVNAAIQNSFQKIILNRVSDTLTITIKVDGLNESQEKSWNMEQTDSYLINDSILKKLN